MKGTIANLFFITFIIIGINADPFLFLPRHMLPSIGIVYNMSFVATFGTSHQTGHYILHALTASNSQTIIGYRAWQLYTIENARVGYEEYHLNGTNFQSTSDPITQECISVFSNRANCTGWLNTEITRWDNRCAMSGFEVPIGMTSKITVIADTLDLKRPVKMDLSITMENSEETQITFRFTSKTEGTTFPNIKCSN